MVRKLSFILFACFSSLLISKEIPAETHMLVRAIILDSTEKYLLCAYDPQLNTDRTALFYHLPGGHIAYNQDAASALCEHLKSRLNLEITVDYCVGAFERSWDGQPKSITCHKHEVTLVFKAKLKDHFDLLPEPVSLNSDKLMFTWIAIEQIGKIDLRPHVIPDMFAKWLSNSNSFFAGEMHIE